MRRVQASAGQGRECEAHPGEEARQIRLDCRLGRRALEEKVVLASLELANLGAPAAVADPAILSAVAWAPVVAERALRDERLLRHHRDRPGRLRTRRHSGLDSGFMRLLAALSGWQRWCAAQGAWRASQHCWPSESVQRRCVTHLRSRDHAVRHHKTLGHHCSGEHHGRAVGGGKIHFHTSTISGFFRGACTGPAFEPCTIMGATGSLRFCCGSKASTELRSSGFHGPGWGRRRRPGRACPAPQPPSMPRTHATIHHSHGSCQTLRPCPPI